MNENQKAISSFIKSVDTLNVVALERAIKYGLNLNTPLSSHPDVDFSLIKAKITLNNKLLSQKPIPFLISFLLEKNKDNDFSGFHNSWNSFIYAPDDISGNILSRAPEKAKEKKIHEFMKSALEIMILSGASLNERSGATAQSISIENMIKNQAKSFFELAVSLNTKKKMSEMVESLNLPAAAKPRKII